MHSPLPNGTPRLHNPFFTSRPDTDSWPDEPWGVRSWSEPSLKARLPGGHLQPLAAPPRSPFLALAYLERVPSEFQHQQQLEARRQARKLVNCAWRVAFERLGVNKREIPPWPPREKPPVHALTLPARSIYAPKPYRFPEVLEGGGSTIRRSTSAAPSSPASSPSSRSGSASQPRYEEAMRKMRDIARLQHGAPYTIAQVHAEVEANVRHRKARDTRALCGFLGPLQLGSGTTRMQRKLPFDNCKGISPGIVKQSAPLKAIKAPE
mmetsp:Transcript_13760/g.27782  ORF Transcript_13760/g.27782 Transcript_13760/m.27782 type:complete len:265 (-) Transcript_13760:242-1036(-)